jgi:hypothetical protein
MALSDRKLTIVVSIRQIVIALAIGVIVILGIAGFYVHRTIVAAKENMRRKYLKSSRILMYELKDLLTDSALQRNSSKHLRYKRGMHLLRNRCFDDDVVAFSFNVVDCNNVGPMAQIRYVDELIKVAQVNYTPSNDDPNTLGELFLAPENMPHPRMRLFGITNLCILLEVDKSLSDSDPPYSQLKGERWYLVVPKATFDRITTLEGQFMLLDKKGKILDRFALKELSDKGGQVSVSDANSVL